MEIPKSEIFFQKVLEPAIGEIYFQFDRFTGFPVLIISGQYNDPETGRLSNYWYWINLQTGERESGYGCFYKLLERKEALKDGSTAD